MRRVITAEAPSRGVNGMRFGCWIPGEKPLVWFDLECGHVRGFRQEDAPSTKAEIECLHCWEPPCAE